MHCIQVHISVSALPSTQPPDETLFQSNQSMEVTSTLLTQPPDEVLPSIHHILTSLLIPSFFEISLLLALQGPL